MPQLDPSSFSSQLFWLTISFVMLYIALARYLLPRVQSVLDMRTRTMESDIGQAERLKSQAERARDVYEAAIADAWAKSKAIIAEAKAATAADAAAQQVKLDAEITRKLGQSDAGIRQAKKEVMGKLLPVAGELAEAITFALVNHKPASGEISKAMDKFESKGK